MRFDVARIDLRLRRRSVLWFTVGVAAYTFLLVAMYPAIKSDSSLGALTADNPTVAALLGVSGSFTSPAGWINGNLYANFFPLMILLMTIGYGASSIAGQSETGQLGLVASIPISRARLIGEKILVLIALAIPLTLATLACTLLGRQYELALPGWPLIGTTAAVLLMGIDFGLLALAIGAASGSRGLALGLTSAIAAASYLVSSLAPVVGWIRSIRGVSLFYWAVGDDQLSSGPSTGALAVLVLTGVALALAAAILIKRLDIR
jgi:ABC-2 type transport system permease protein